MAYVNGNFDDDMEDSENSEDSEDEISNNSNLENDKYWIIDSNIIFTPGFNEKLDKYINIINIAIKQYF
jgi:hypothetical protein